MGERALPSVSVIVVNYRDASGDGSAGQIAAAVPQARLIRSATNCGFAGGCNLGASLATGEIIGFLNSDARPHRDWVRAAMPVLAADPGVAAVASKVLDWDGERIDYVDGGLTWYGMGYKPLCAGG